MKATFQLDPCYTLVLGGYLPPGADPSLVSVQIMHEDLPQPITDGSFTAGTDKEPGQPIVTGYTYPPAELVVSLALQRSHVRAIASALLSAATENK